MTNAIRVPYIFAQRIFVDLASRVPLLRTAPLRPPPYVVHRYFLVRWIRIARCVRILDADSICRLLERVLVHCVVLRFSDSIQPICLFAACA